MWLVWLFACAGEVDWGGDPKQGDWDHDGWTGEDGDCANTDPDRHPGAEDRAGDGLDMNCDAVDGVDADGDRHASEASGGDDCDDTRADVHPGAGEVWYDGVDQPCDGGDDYDRDGDGHQAEAYGGDDCDDQDGRYPGPEVFDGEDDDCDGCVDEPDYAVSLVSSGGDTWLEVVVTQGDPHGYALGLMVEGDGWTGEACRDGVTDCHPMGRDGQSFLVVDDPADYNPATTTLQGSLSGLGWAFWDSAGTCTTGGEGSAYYEAVGCCLAP